MGALIRLLLVLMDWTRKVKHSRLTILSATVAGVVAGLGSTALIAVINAVLAGDEANSVELIIGFAALCLVVPVSGFLSGFLLLRLTAQVAHDLRLRMSLQILNAPYRFLEKLGRHRLMATINDDIPAVTAAITSLPVLFVHLAVMLGCLFYLGWLSWPLLLLLLVYLLVGLISYQMPVIKSAKFFRLMREEWDALFNALRALTEGTKELKVNRDRRKAFRSQQLEPAVEGIRRYGIAASTLTIAAGNWGQVLFFVFIGLSLFVSPLVVDVEHKALTGYTLAVLYMIVPMTSILGTLPVFGRAYVAAEKVKELGLSLAEQPSEEKEALQETGKKWERIELSGVTHVFRNDGQEEFQLGPLDLAFSPGDLVFLIGGNGSGKTTLAKLLVGLYEPEEGVMLMDGERIAMDNVDEYRQYFSVVFNDFFLFDRLFGIGTDGLEEKGREYLAQLQLDDKVKIEGDRLSTLDLSQGQRKRLALLTAYLEDRPIYIFDEWAADQDPMFKDVFYHKILPDLKSRGKTVIAISHDDRYYHLADRIIKLERGGIEYDRRQDATE